MVFDNGAQIYRIERILGSYRRRLSLLIIMIPISYVKVVCEGLWGAPSDPTKLLR